MPKFTDTKLGVSTIYLLKHRSVKHMERVSGCSNLKIIYWNIYIHNEKIKIQIKHVICVECIQ